MFDQHMTLSQKLSKLTRHDFVFGGDEEASREYICVVQEVSKEFLFVRRITSQEKLKVDLTTGFFYELDGGIAVCKILSIAALPAGLYSQICAIERKMRIAHSEQMLKFTEPEIEAMLAVGEHYKTFPIEP